MKRSVVPFALAIFAIGLVAAAAGAHAQTSTCTPATDPCQVCIAPSCLTAPTPGPTPTPCVGGCVGGPGDGGTTFTTSVVNCTGNFPQTTLTTTVTIGPATICIGDNKSTPFVIAAGNTNIDVATNNISAAAPSSVGIPTLSIWGLVAIAVALGAFGLRRLAG